MVCDLACGCGYGLWSPTAITETIKEPREPEPREPGCLANRPKRNWPNPDRHNAPTKASHAKRKLANRSHSRTEPLRTAARNKWLRMTPNRGHLAKRSAKGRQVQLKACRVERNAYQAQRKGVPNAAQGVPNAAQRGAKGSATRAKRSAGHGKCSAKPPRRVKCSAKGCRV